MYLGGITFSINKSFGRLQLIPESQGLRFYYTPIVDGVEQPNSPGFLNMLIPLDAVGGLWATTRAFLYGVESLDENVILQAGEGSAESDTLVKLYRDKPRGQQGRLSGEETCWLRIVTGRSEEERRRIKLGPRDLLCIELACNAVLVLAGEAGTHRPQPV
ncbi:MAG: hypothetical protein J5J00_16380 [Deltaproteobacteria bacterium]|nr:hypothetical protein [Deltaproteobacteria bacterium]